MAEESKITIKIYLEDGRRFKYEVANCKKAREHMHRIVNFGWRTEEDGNLVYYPVHQVNKVVAIGCGKEAYVEYPAK